MDQRQATSKRLDLSLAAVTAAKRAYVLRRGVQNVDLDSPEDLEQIYFRDIVDFAVEEFRERLEKSLLKIGLVKRKLQHRQRPVSITTWVGTLEVMAQKYDLSKIQIVRCLLEMLAASEKQQAPLSSDD